MRGGTLGVALVLILTVFSVAVSASPIAPRASALQAHTPIFIMGDGHFTAANGVTGGLGTAASPYVISNWSIAVSSGIGIEIRDTTAPFVVRDVEIFDPAPTPGARPLAIHLANLSTAVLEEFSLINVSTGVWATDVGGLVIQSGSVRLVHSSDGVEGVSVFRGTNVSIASVAFAEGLGGVNAHSIGNLTLSGCAFDRVGTEDVDIWDSHNVTVDHNWLNASYLGLSVVNSSRLTVASNHVVGGQLSVYFDASDNSTVFENDFERPRQDAIQFDVDSRFPGHVPAHYTLYHNNFVNGSVAILVPLQASAWDDGYPSGGNFWSAYAGADACRGADQADCSNRDGIGDTTYAPLGSSNFGFVDRYPLIRPWPLPHAPPVARLVVDVAKGVAGSPMRFNASTSSDAADPLERLQFRWDLDGDGLWDGGWSSNATAYHRYDRTGTYVVRVQVRNTAGLADEATALLDIDAPPLLLPSYAVLAVAAAAGMAAGAYLWWRRSRRARRRVPPPPTGPLP